MTEQHIIVGNALIGDACWIWPALVPEPVRKTVVCIPYNRGTIEMLRDVVGLQVDAIVEVTEKGANSPFANIQEYVDWTEKYIAKQEGIHYRYFNPTHDLNPMWFPHWHQPCKCTSLWQHRARHRSPGHVPYMTAQIDSWHSWKRVNALEVVQYPLPVKCIARSNELTVPGSELIIDQPFSTVGETLLGADLHVGINSAVTVAAMLLGVPTILANFGRVGDWENIPDTVNILIEPGVDAIVEAIDEMRRRHARVHEG